MVRPKYSVGSGRSFELDAQGVNLGASRNSSRELIPAAVETVIEVLGLRDVDAYVLPPDEICEEPLDRSAGGPQK